MKVIVLAAGYATRLLPLTEKLAKPLIDVAGQPILDHIVKRVLELDDLTELIVVSNHRYIDAFREWRRDFEARFASDLPVQLLDDGSTTDDNKRGAVGDIRFALDHVDLAGEAWLVVAGDNLLQCDLRPLQARFRAQGTPLLVVRPVDHGRGPSRYNDVELDANERVTSFREKPRSPRGRLAAIALYFFTPAVVDALERYLAEGGNPDAPGHFIAWLVEQTPVHAARLEGCWFDIGSHETLRQAREALEG